MLSAVETTRPAIEAARHRLDISLPAQPLTVDADFVRLAQVLANLLNNAAKYTDPGGRIALSVRGEGGDAVTGGDLGARQRRRHPARSCCRACSTCSRRWTAPSTARRAAWASAWRSPRAWSRCTAARSRWRATGPARAANSSCACRATESAATPGRGDARSTPPLKPGSARRRVLVVDDNVDAAQSLGLLLGQMGCEVQIAHGGAAAIEAARAGQPHLVLLDISMPGVDGYSVVRRLKQDLAFRDVPFIAVTGLGREADRDRAREAGFNEHLVKPVSPEALREVLERF